MIKRYTLNDGSITEWQDGEYVRHSDIEHLLTHKTLDEHRADFEAWIQGAQLNKTSKGVYISTQARTAWEAYKFAKGIEE